MSYYKQQTVNIKFNKVLLDSINENKMFYVYTGLVISAIIAMQIIFPKLYGDFVSNIPDSINNLNYLSIIVVLLPYIIAEFLHYTSDIISSHVTPKIELTIIKKISENVIESAKTSKKEFNSNEFMLNIKKIFDIGYSYHSVMAYVVPAIIVSTGIGWNIIKADTTLGLVTLVILIITFIALVYMSQECTHQTIVTEEHVNHFCDDINDVFGNVDHVLASGTDKSELNRLDDKKNDIYKQCSSRDVCNTHLKFTFSIAYFIIMVIVNGMTLKLYYENKMEKATLVTIFFMVLSLVMLYDSLIHELQNITGCVGAYKEMEKYFNGFEIVDESKLKDDMIVSRGDIKFENIGLQFDKKVVFNNFNLNIKENSKVGLIGEIGSGKTSLLKILVDIVPYTGNVYIDGQNTNEYKHNSIIRNIAYIPQNPILFDRTIFENLSYGTDKNMAQVLELIEYYGLSQIFDSFEKKLYTKVGKNGEKISGGQRQLVYILRSLINNKKILLLDEPTSSLDSDYKKILIDLLKKINNKTIIIVTHDNDILPLFDRILVFDKGKIIEDIV